MNAIIEVLSNIPGWGTFLCVVGLWTFLAVWLTRFYSRFQNLEKKVEDFIPDVDRRFNEVDRRFERMEKKMEKRFDKIDERFDKIDERFSKSDEKFERLFSYLLDNNPNSLRKTK